MKFENIMLHLPIVPKKHNELRLVFVSKKNQRCGGVTLIFNQFVKKKNAMLHISIYSIWIVAIILSRLNLRFIALRTQVGKKKKSA